jgi:hypothetical protein
MVFCFMSSPAFVRDIDFFSPLKGSTCCDWLPKSYHFQLDMLAQARNCCCRGYCNELTLHLQGSRTWPSYLRHTCLCARGHTHTHTHTHTHCLTAAFKSVSLNCRFAKLSVLGGWKDVVMFCLALSQPSPQCHLHTAQSTPSLHGSHIG